MHTWSHKVGSEGTVGLGIDMDAFLHMSWWRLYYDGVLRFAKEGLQTYPKHSKSSCIEITSFIHCLIPW